MLFFKEIKLSIRSKSQFILTQITRIFFFLIILYNAVSLAVIRRMYFRYATIPKKPKPKVNLYKCEAGYFHSSLVRTTFFPPRISKNKKSSHSKIKVVCLLWHLHETQKINTKSLLYIRHRWHLNEPGPSTLDDWWSIAKDYWPLWSDLYNQKFLYASEKSFLKKCNKFCEDLQGH